MGSGRERAAAKLFATRGFERTSVDEIATTAGVAKGTIFYHFTLKDLRPSRDLAM